MSKRPNEMTSSSSRALRAWYARWKPGGFSSPGSHARRNWSHAPGLRRRAENITNMRHLLRRMERSPLPLRPPTATRASTSTSTRCPSGSRPSAGRSASSSTRPPPRSRRRSSGGCSPTSCSRATSARCWPPRTTSTSSSTTAPSCRTPKASSPAATATRRPAPSPSTRASRSTRPRCGGCSSRSSPTTARAGGGGSSARADRPRNDGGAGRCAGPASASGPDGRLAAIALAVDLDLLLGHGVGDLALLLHGVLVEAHALLRHGALLHDGVLGVGRVLVLLLGDRGAVGRVVDVGVGDRLALDADLLALRRHRRLHLVGDDVLAQAGAARLTLRLADVKLLLGARHRVVRGRARR